jgi:carboxymethylenebutenolidase
MKPSERAASPEAIPLRVTTLATKAGAVAAVLATPEAAWTSGVVLIADLDGLDESVCAACRRLAAHGHAALALQFPAARLEGITEALGRKSADLLALMDAVNVALAFLRAAAPAPLGRLATLGYGAGGFVALAAGYRCQVGVAVSLYGKGPTTLRKHLAEIVDRPKPQASILCLLGGADEDVSPDDLRVIQDRLTAFGMPHTLIVYPRTRSDFCRPEGPTYREREAEDAWDKILHALKTAPRLRHRFARKQTA